MIGESIRIKKENKMIKCECCKKEIDPSEQGKYFVTTSNGATKYPLCKECYDNHPYTYGGNEAIKQTRKGAACHLHPLINKEED
jgi:hypothetical protein